jgi:6-pyruvoyltetrahydropterin/6-carboxytetrahydropterin synthase
MYRVGVKGSFQARHFLNGDFEDETTPHSHAYTVDWTLATQELDENGFSLDISILEEVLEIVLRDLDERLLNDLEYFEFRQASVENTAAFLNEMLFGILEEREFPIARVVEREIKIWESETAWASYVERA